MWEFLGNLTEEKTLIVFLEGKQSRPERVDNALFTRRTRRKVVRSTPEPFEK